MLDVKIWFLEAAGREAECQIALDGVHVAKVFETWLVFWGVWFTLHLCVVLHAVGYDVSEGFVL